MTLRSEVLGFARILAAAGCGSSEASRSAPPRRRHRRLGAPGDRSLRLLSVDGVATVIQDDFANTYQRIDPPPS